MKPIHTLFTGLGSVLFAILISGSALAANHREAPLTALDHKADLTDFFAFVSYDNASQVTMILDVDPLLEPGNGPNYFPFDPEILYAIRVDNNNNAIEDIVFEVRFKTEIGLPNVFTGFVGAGVTGIPAPANSPPPVPPGTLIVPPAINNLTDPGLSLRQRYTVTMVKSGVRTVLAQNLIAVPSNVGPRTMPNYEGLFLQGINTLPQPNGDIIKVFAGTVDDPFWIDLGAAFDSLNFRMLGFWGTTSRPKTKTFSGTPGAAPLLSTTQTQIQRMGQPLFNELIIGTGFKDKFSMSQPRNDAQFAFFALDPLLARVINAAYAGAVPVPTPPRTDLLPLVTYAP